MTSEDASPKKSGFPFLAVIVTMILTLVVAGASAYFLGYLGPKARAGMTDMKAPSGKSASSAQAAGGGKGKILYWRAPMNPMEIYDHPGKSAMGMDLVPVYANEAGGGTKITISPVIEQDTGIRTAVVKEGPLSHTIRAYGRVTYDETRITRINPKYSGWIEKLYIDYTGQSVKKGAPLFDIYSPDLVTVQQDYLAALRNFRRDPNRANGQTLQSVRQRLRYYDVSDGEIQAIEKRGAVLHSLTIRSPFSGIVVEKMAFEGNYIKAGTAVYEITDLSRVWVNAHIYEYELSQVKEGMPVEMTLPYLPGKRFQGKIDFIYPYLQQQTRDVVARIEVANPDLELKPDMVADVFIRTSVGQQGIQIPNEAVIRTGLRNLVFLALKDHSFAAQTVTLGMPLDNGMIQILKGLTPGETVVSSGEFLLDSESNLREAVQKMMKPGKGGQKPALQSEPGKTGQPDDFFKDMESTGSKRDAKEDFFKELEKN
jgi:RND family efflux transporter MFP subunit